MTERTTRLLTAEELSGIPMGCGWIEYPQDEEEPVDPGELIQRIAWADGNFAMEACYSDMERIQRNYNNPRGQRIWLGEDAPTEAQRATERWSAA